MGPMGHRGPNRVGGRPRADHYGKDGDPVTTATAPGFDTAAAPVIERARALAAATTADELRAYYAATGRDDLAAETWPGIQIAALESARVLLAEAAALLAAASAAPAPRAVPVEVRDDEDTRTHAEVADNPLSPDWSVRMEVGAGEYPSKSTWLDADTALTLGYALVGLGTEAKRRNLDAHG